MAASPDDDIVEFLEECFLSGVPHVRCGKMCLCIRTRQGEPARSPVLCQSHLRGMLDDARDDTSRDPRTFVIVGDSGSGKSEAFRSCMMHLCDKSETASARISASVLVLECLGNARTLQNDNASRFGKMLVCTFFDGPASAPCPGLHTFLLESERALPSGAESSFQIFHAVLRSREMRECYGLHSIDGSLLGPPPAAPVPDWDRLKVTSEAAGLCGDLVSSIARVVVGLLWLSIRDYPSAASALGLPPPLLVQTLARRRLRAGAAEIWEDCTLEETRQRTRQFAATLYDRLFARATESLRAEGRHLDGTKTVCIVDAFSIAQPTRVCDDYALAYLSEVAACCTWATLEHGDAVCCDERSPSLPRSLHPPTAPFEGAPDCGFCGHAESGRMPPLPFLTRHYMGHLQYCHRRFADGLRSPPPEMLCMMRAASPSIAALFDQRESAGRSGLRGIGDTSACDVVLCVRPSSRPDAQTVDKAYLRRQLETWGAFRAYSSAQRSCAHRIEHPDFFVAHPQLASREGLLLREGVSSDAVAFYMSHACKAELERKNAALLILASWRRCARRNGRQGSRPPSPSTRWAAKLIQARQRARCFEAEVKRLTTQLHALSAQLARRDNWLFRAKQLMLQRAPTLPPGWPQG